MFQASLEANQLHVRLPKPFVGRFKFDLRIYVLVTSCDPPRIFVCNEGLTHFATSASSDLLHNNVVSKHAY